MLPTLEELGIDKLSVDQRITLVGQIWDSISDFEDSEPIPGWHLEIIENRIAESDANPKSRITRAELNHRLRQQK